MLKGDKFFVLNFLSEAKKVVKILSWHRIKERKFYRAKIYKHRLI